MTKELFERYRDICGEVQDLEGRMACVEGGRSREHARLLARWNEWMEKKIEIETFADSLPWSKRVLARAVMKHGTRWNVVRREIGSYKSPDALRVEYNRIFEKNF